MSFPKKMQPISRKIVVLTGSAASCREKQDNLMGGEMSR